MSTSPYAVEMLHITKRFPGIIANDDITLQLKKGEIHALLGENGAGKSTLMSVLFGLYQPEEGEILKDGQKVTNNDMGKLLGFTGQNYSKKLAKMFFSYDELVLIAERLTCPLDKLVYFMTGKRVKEVS